MDAKRLQLLGAFAAGCLATLSFVGSWWSDGETPPKLVSGVRAVTPPHAVAASVGEGASLLSSESVSVDGESADGVVADAEAKVTTPDDADDAKAGSGNSLAEVLSRLEAAYREELRREQRLRDEEAAALRAEPAPDVSDRAMAVVAPMAPVTAAPVAPVVPAAPVVPPPVAAAELAAVAPAAAVVAQNQAPRGVSTGDIHVGDEHRTVNVGSVHQGDAYALQQQLALIQYIQFVALSQHGAAVAPPHGPRRLGARRVPAFSTQLTNPDNPWGFQFPPTVLVK